MGSAAGQEHVRVGQQHGQGLGSGVEGEEMLLEEAQAGGVVFTENPFAGEVELIEIVELEQGGEGRHAEGLGGSGACGGDRRWGARYGAVCCGGGASCEALGAGQLGGCGGCSWSSG